MVFVEAGFHGAGNSNAEALGEVKLISLAKVAEAAVPDGDVFGGNAGVDEAAGDGFDDGLARAAGAGRGVNFDADFVVGGNEAEPGGGFVGLAGEGDDAV